MNGSIVRVILLPDLTSVLSESRVLKIVRDGVVVITVTSLHTFYRRHPKLIRPCVEEKCLLNILRPNSHPCQVLHTIIDAFKADLQVLAFLEEPLSFIFISNVMERFSSIQSICGENCR